MAMQIRKILPHKKYGPKIQDGGITRPEPGVRRVLQILKNWVLGPFIRI